MERIGRGRQRCRAGAVVAAVAEGVTVRADQEQAYRIGRVVGEGHVSRDVLHAAGNVELVELLLPLAYIAAVAAGQRAAEGAASRDVNGAAQGDGNRVALRAQVAVD